jgi:4-hydroxythreonine-4-phosphate dehydrogenase
MKNNIRVGITQGDINGIGYEVIIKTLQDPRVTENCTPIVYGSPKVASYHRKALNISNFNFNSINSPEEASPKKPNIINCLDDEIRVELGKSTEIAGEASFKTLETAITDLINGKIDVLVTAPINKKNIQTENFRFPGHTEYLTEKMGSKESLMLLVSDVLKVGVVTGHIAVNKVSAALSVEKIMSKLRILNQSLIEDFAIRKPRIAILGLNPHCGDEGVIGTEEIEIINPAIEQARKENILAFGPFPADGFFGNGNFKSFDAVLAMYHDQGLAPFKALVFDRGVNFTAGLPMVRTSPAHGTAYELAGKNEASEESFRNALFLACDIFNNRQEYYRLNKNPLQKHDTANL